MNYNVISKLNYTFNEGKMEFRLTQPMPFRGHGHIHALSLSTRIYGTVFFKKGK